MEISTQQTGIRLLVDEPLIDLGLYDLFFDYCIMTFYAIFKNIGFTTDSLTTMPWVDRLAMTSEVETSELEKVLEKVVAVKADISFLLQTFSEKNN